jgi:dihydropteroate synthase
VRWLHDVRQALNIGKNAVDNTSFIQQEQASILQSPMPPRGVAADGQLENRVYIAPGTVVWDNTAETMINAGRALPVAGGKGAFSSCMLFVRNADAGAVAYRVSLTGLRQWAHEEGEAVAAHIEAALGTIAAKRADFGGLSLTNGAKIMGILNVTPDSFSDGGTTTTTAQAVAKGVALMAAGADVIDVGGESTRPGAAPVPIDEEIRRVVPVITELAHKNIPVSIDSRNAAVMQAAIDAGARIINDVSALEHDPDAVQVVARTGVPVIIMHMRGTPDTMQDHASYACAPLDVYDHLFERMAFCMINGIPPEKIMVDPGIGFAKTVVHNIETLAHLGVLHGLGCGILLGASRKRFIEHICPGTSPLQRTPGSLIAAYSAAEQGVQMLRVHDVAETKQALLVGQALATF